jgi:putative Holliday junction resolvase
MTNASVAQPAQCAMSGTGESMNGAPIDRALTNDASSAVPAAFQRFLAFDYGQLRTGMASGNRLLGAATALPTVRAAGDSRFEPIGACIREWEPDALVVGVPFHPDGASHENTVRARRFARRLHGRFGLPVFEVDERFSTTEALASGARDADAASACIILEQFLRSLT